MPEMKQNLLLRIRVKQIRATAAVMFLLQRIPGTRSVVKLLGFSNLCARVLVGYRRAFSNLKEAERCIDSYGFAMQEHPDVVRNHLALAKRARPSDYAALFYLRHITAENASVLDIGGSAGNLFYCYSQYLEFASSLSWTVYELPEVAQSGRQLAAARSESRLRFITDLRECGAVDIMLISGALHYFDETPVSFMERLPAKPRHVIVNRSPFLRGISAVAIQDAGSYLAAARIVERDHFLRDMASANYELVDEWSAPELGLRLPLHPDLCVHAYSGFYFRLRNSE
jgi:putative methyltransferase (TIGR04325 family)